jgi:hypothetical protein
MYHPLCYSTSMVDEWNMSADGEKQSTQKTSVTLPPYLPQIPYWLACDLWHGLKKLQPGSWFEDQQKAALGSYINTSHRHVNLRGICGGHSGTGTWFPMTTLIFFRQ